VLRAHGFAVVWPMRRVQKVASVTWNGEASPAEAFPHDVQQGIPPSLSIDTAAMLPTLVATSEIVGDCCAFMGFMTSKEKVWLVHSSNWEAGNNVRLLSTWNVMLAPDPPDREYCEIFTCPPDVYPEPGDVTTGLHKTME